MVVTLMSLAIALASLGCGGLSKEAEEHLNSGVDLQQEGRLEAAIAEYDEVIRLAPELALAYNNRAMAFVSLGQYQRAIQDFDEPILLDPMDAGSIVNRGYALKYQREMQPYNEAFRLQPQNAAAYNERGTAYYGLGHHRLAIRDYDEAIRIAP